MSTLAPAEKNAITRDGRNYSQATGEHWGDFVQVNVLDAIDIAQAEAQEAALRVDKSEGGTLSATAAVALAFRAPVAGVISKLPIWVETTIATSDTNYWTFSAVNKGPAGTGTTAVLGAVDGNTTKTTGGSALTAFIARDLTLHGTGANLVVAAGDVIVVTATKTAAASDLVKLRGQMEVTPS